VPSVAREVGSGNLVRPRGFDTAINERPHHIWVGPLRPGLRASLLCGQIGDVAQWLFVGISTFHRAGKQFAAEIRHYPPPEDPL
jgi:hypothetical protein